MLKLKLIFISFILLSIFSQCDNQSPIPEVYVNFTIQLDDPVYVGLNPVGASVFIPGVGNKGIIVTHVDISKFLAYDATCTYDPSDSWGRVVIDASGISAVDTVCGSTYSLMLNGMVTKGPSGLPLIEYVADYNANLNSLHIHN
jgi:hypothetical protein